MFAAGFFLCLCFQAFSTEVIFISNRFNNSKIINIDNAHIGFVYNISRYEYISITNSFIDDVFVFEKMNKAKHVIFINNSFEFPRELHLNNYNYLDISFSDIQNIVLYSNFESFRCKYCKIEKLQFESLKMLDVSNNDLFDINGKAVIDLNIQYQSTSSKFINFCKIKKIKILHTAGNYFSLFKEHNIKILECLKEIEYLDVSYNKLNDLNVQISTLKYLNASNNQISSLDILFYELFPNLLELDLSSNLLYEVHAMSLPNKLTFFNFSFNFVENIYNVSLLPINSTFNRILCKCNINFMMSLLDFKHVTCYDFFNKDIMKTFETECIIPSTKKVFNTTKTREKNYSTERMFDETTKIIINKNSTNSACSLICNFFILLKCFFFFFLI